MIYNISCGAPGAWGLGGCDFEMNGLEPSMGGG